VCARVGNQWSHGVVTAQVRTDAVRSLRHQHRDLHQSTYPVPLRRLGLILLSTSYRASHLVLLLPEDPTPMTLLGIEKFSDVVAGDLGMYRVGSHGGSIVGKQVAKSCLSMVIVTQIYFGV
jgi:hypothetical protein